MLASTQTSRGIVQHQDALAGLDVLAGQHEGAVDHGRHGAADRAVLDVDLLLGELRLEIRRPDDRAARSARRSRRSRSCSTCASSRLPSACSYSACELQELALELGHRRLRHLELALVGDLGGRTATCCARARASRGRGPTAAPASAFSRTVTADVRVRMTASVWFSSSRRSAMSRSRSAWMPSICALQARRPRAWRRGRRCAITTLARGHARPLERRQLDHPAVGAARDGHDVGRRAGVVLVDMGEAEIDLAAAIGDRQQHHGGDGENPRPQEGGRDRATMPCRAPAAGRSRG